jgi:hypothetical protein
LWEKKVGFLKKLFLRTFYLGFHGVGKVRGRVADMRTSETLGRVLTCLGHWAVTEQVTAGLPAQ